MYPPFSSYAPAEFEHPKNPDLTILDQTMQFYPFLFYARQEIRNGHLPLWNPYMLFAGMSFMFCAFNIVWLNHPQANVSVFLPWLFLLSYKFIKTGRLRFAGWLALITGVQFLGGHPETSAYILLAAMIYVITLLAFQYKDKRPLSLVIKKFSLLLGSFVLGFMIASPMLLPFLSELSKSATYILRSKPNAFFLSLKALPVFLAPQFYGSPVYNNCWGPCNFNEQSGYVGIAALMLAIIAIVFRKYRYRDILFFCFLAFGSLLIVFGIPPFFQMFIALPFFGHMANNRLILIYQFSIIMLAGIGIDIICRWTAKGIPLVKQKIKDKQQISQNKEQGKQAIGFKKLKFISLITGISLFVIEVCFILYLLFIGKIQHFDTTIYTSSIVCLFIIGLFITIIYSIGSIPDVKKVIIVIIGLQFIDLFVYGYNYNPQIDKDWIFPDIPILSNIRANLDNYRLTCPGPNYLPNTLMVYGIPDIRGYDFPVNKRYNSFFPLLNDNIVIPDLWYGIFHINNTNKYTLVKYLELVGVKYFPDQRGQQIYQLPLAKRAYLAHEIIPAASPSQALELVRTDIDNLLQDSVIIEGQNHTSQPACADAKQDAVQIVSYEPDRVIIFTASKCQSILVLSDTYDNGWKAYVDEKQVTILHANYLFRGVYLDPGIHKVEFEYKPFSFKLGTVLSAIALIPVIIALFL